MEVSLLVELLLCRDGLEVSLGPYLALMKMRKRMGRLVTVRAQQCVTFLVGNATLTSDYTGAVTVARCADASDSWNAFSGN
jgi:hypothetical protein